VVRLRERGKQGDSTRKQDLSKLGRKTQARGWRGPGAISLALGEGEETFGMEKHRDWGKGEHNTRRDGGLKRGERELRFVRRV